MFSKYLAGPLKAFTIFGVDIYWYAICIVSGMILAILSCTYLTRFREGLKKEYVFDFALIAIPLGVFCARLFYALTDTEIWSISDFFTRTGGLSIIGGVIGGVIGLLLYCHIKKINPLKFMDVLVPCLLLAQAIGRWGNFANQEVFGTQVTDPNMQWFPFAVFIDATNTWHLALFFYEFVLNLTGAIVLAVCLKKVKTNGVVGFAYFVWYGTVRAILEGFRMKEYILGNNVAMSRLFAIIMAVVGVAAIIFLLYKAKKSPPAKKEISAKEETSAKEEKKREDKPQPEVENSAVQKEQEIVAEVKEEKQEKIEEAKQEEVKQEEAKQEEAKQEEKGEVQSAAPQEQPPVAAEKKTEPAKPKEIRLTEKVIVPEGFKPDPVIIDDEEIQRLSDELDAIERSLIRVRTAPLKRPLAARPEVKTAPKAARTPSPQGAKKTAKSTKTTKPPAKKPALKSAAAKTAPKKPVKKDEK